MDKKPVLDAIEKVNIHLVSLTLTPAPKMDLRLDMNVLQPLKISTEAKSSLASIGVVPCVEKETYKTNN